MIDLKYDQQNPFKSHRPLAQGLIKKTHCYFYIIILLSVIICLSSLYNIQILVPVVIYFIINILYCYILKNIAIIDVFCIASGFILRVIFGSVVIGVSPSIWMLCVVFTVSLYLALGKRYKELTSKLQFQSRTSLSYDKNLALSLLNIVASLFIGFYSLYTVLVLPQKNIYFVFFSIMLVIGGFLKYHVYLLQEDNSGDPTEIIISDKVLWIIGVVYVLIILAILYK